MYTYQKHWLLSPQKVPLNVHIKVQAEFFKQLTL